MNLEKAPFLVIWETTRSCALACKHCRAEAVSERNPWELDTREGLRLLDQTVEMGTPLFILSGGDPLNRPDLEELVSHGKSRGLRMATIPAATINLTLERVRKLKEAGLDQIAFSLDGPSAAIHDSFRGADGAFHRTLEGIEFAHKAGIPVQINTCFADWNFNYLEEMIGFIKTRGIVFWEVFFLIPMGRGQLMRGLTAGQFEQAFERLRRLSDEEQFVVKLTEAQHYRRFVVEKEMSLSLTGTGDVQERIQHLMARPRGFKGGLGRAPQAVNAGKGMLFIDHVGNICPSGFLPISAGNVRAEALADVYRNSPLFRELRNASLLKGKCRLCDYATGCGGSRARAYAMTGDYLAADPSCAYAPGA